MSKLRRGGYLLLAIVLPLAIACGDGEHAAHAEETENHEHHEHHDHADHSEHADVEEAIEAPGHHSASGGLVMDGDDKWKADATTNEAIFKMQQSVQSFQEEGLTAAADYKRLGEELSGHFAELVKKCTMKGEAHDQLHVFLEMLQPKIKSLSTTTDPAEAENVVEETDALLLEYFRFFE